MEFYITCQIQMETKARSWYVNLLNWGVTVITSSSVPKVNAASFRASFSTATSSSGPTIPRSVQLQVVLVLQYIFVLMIVKQTSQLIKKNDQENAANQILTS